MIVSNIQNTSNRNNYTYSNAKFAYVDKAILKDEVSFGNKKQKPKKPEAEVANDGINDIDNNSLKTSKSDLNTATDGISMQEFLEKENEALKNKDIDLPKIDTPDIPDLKLENLDLEDDIKTISEDIDKSTKSSMFKSILVEFGVGAVVVGAIYYFLTKNRKHNKNLDKQV